MGKGSNASFFENTHQITPIFSRSCYIKLLLMTQVHLLSNDPPQGHLRSHGVTDGFLPITFDRMEIKKWKWHKCVCLIKTHRYICNMTYLGHIGSPRDLDLRSNFEKWPFKIFPTSDDLRNGFSMKFWSGKSVFNNSQKSLIFRPKVYKSVSRVWDRNVSKSM